MKNISPGIIWLFFLSVSDWKDWILEKDKYSIYIYIYIFWNLIWHIKIKKSREYDHGTNIDFQLNYLNYFVKLGKTRDFFVSRIKFLFIFLFNFSIRFENMTLKSHAGGLRYCKRSRIVSVNFDLYFYLFLNF